MNANYPKTGILRQVVAQMRIAKQLRAEAAATSNLAKWEQRTAAAMRAEHMAACLMGMR